MGRGRRQRVACRRPAPKPLERPRPLPLTDPLPRQGGPFAFGGLTSHRGEREQRNRSDTVVHDSHRDALFCSRVRNVRLTELCPVESITGDSRLNADALALAYAKAAKVGFLRTSAHLGGLAWTGRFPERSSGLRPRRTPPRCHPAPSSDPVGVVAAGSERRRGPRPASVLARSRHAASASYSRAISSIIVDSAGSSHSRAAARASSARVSQ